LKKVYSCNNWFSILWNHTLPDDGLGPVSASVHSSVSCPSSSKSRLPATFFDCALAWIEQRHQIQQGRCGMKEEEFTNINSIVTEQELFSESQIEGLRSKLISQLKNMIAYLDRRYHGEKKLHFEGNRTIPVFPGQEINDDFLNKFVATQMGTLKDHVSTQNVGIIPSNVLDMFDELVIGWNAISALGLNVVTGNVRADIEIKNQADTDTDSVSTTTSEPLKISIPLASPSLQSTLEIPRIYYPRDGFAGTIINGENNLEFNTTPVAQVAQLYVPVRNPSGTPIRVRLATMLSHKRKSPPLNRGTFYSSVDSDFFVQTTPKDLNPWWTGGSYYLADQKGTMMGSTHNVTLKAGKGASLRLSNPSLHSSVAFVQGCVGRRCGYTVPKDAKKTISPQAYISSIGASAATGETLRGRYYNRDGGENELSSSAERNIEESQPFALGLKSLQEIIIPPFGVGQIGPVFFRPPSRRTFKGVLFLENNLTGLENVIVEGKGGWEKVVFFDSLAMGMNGDDLESRYGKPTLTFSGSGNIGPIVKSVVVANVGDTVVKFENAHLSEASISHSSKHQSKFDRSRAREPTNLPETSRCNKRGFTLLGCYDDITKIKEEDTHGVILPLVNKVMKYISKFIPDRAPTRGTNEQSNMSNILDGFSLSPNETKILHISHTPDSTFSSMYIALNLEVKRIDDRSQRLDPQDLQSTSQHGVFQDKTLQLLLGYDLKSSETRRPAQLKQFSQEKQAKHADMDEVKSSYVESERLKPFIQRILEMLVALVPLLMLSFILLDMFSGSRQRYAASKSFEAVLSPSNGIVQTRELMSSRKNNTDNWICAYRCLSRAEPSFSDLQHIGREQTRQMVLGRYRKKSVIHPQCILPNGTFVRERHSSVGHTDGNEVKGGSTVKDERSTSPMLLRRNAGPMTVIFCRCRDLNVSISPFDDYYMTKIPATSCGLYWREAARRGIISNPTGNSSVVEQQSVNPNLCLTSSPARIEIKEEVSQKIVGVNAAAKNTSIHVARTLSTPRLHNDKYGNQKINGDTIKQTTTKIEPDHALSKFKVNKSLSQSKIIQVVEKSQAHLKQNGKPKINTKVTKYSKAIDIDGHGKKPLQIKSDLSAMEKKNIFVKGTEKQTNAIPTPLSSRRNIRSKVSSNGLVDPSKFPKIHSITEPKINQIIRRRDEQEKSINATLATYRPTTDVSPVTGETYTRKVAGTESDEIYHFSSPKSKPKPKPKPEPVSANPLSSLSVKDKFLLKGLDTKEDPLLRYTPTKSASEKNGSQNSLPCLLLPELVSQNSSLDGSSARSVIGEEYSSHNLPIRPPPGLSPPPGFASPMNAVNSTSEVSIDGGEKSVGVVPPSIVSPHIKDSVLFEAVLIDSSSKLTKDCKNTEEVRILSPEEIDPLLLGKDPKVKKSSNPIEDEPLLGLGHDFNVMNFLNFLEDNVTDDGKSEQDKIDDAVGLSSLDTNNALATLSYNSMPSSIRSNPWGGDPETSRALAYGIEVEGESENDVEEHLTAARIFGIDGLTTDGDDLDMKKDELFEDSFFNNLLQED